MEKNSGVPKHIAIIMDGNGRWATERRLPKIAGHRAGSKTVEVVMDAAREIGVEILTLYAFSTENWKRPKEEVEALFLLLEDYIDREAARLHKNNIRLSVIGRIRELPARLQDKIARTVAMTAGNTAFTLNIALNYGGRAEIVDAARALALDVKAGRVSAVDIDEALFSRYLYTKDLPDPDLMIRTSGEFRISNFLIWQVSYAEIYVTKKLWPDFGKEDLRKAVAEYQGRERRFGG